MSKKTAPEPQSAALAPVEQPLNGPITLSPELAALYQDASKENLAHVNDAFYRLSIQGARYKVEGKLIGNEGIRFEAIIVQILPVNLFFKAKFDPAKPTPPDCFSYGGVTPDPSVANKESDTCAGCPQNQYGSAKDENGVVKKGKACGNTHRLVLKVEGVELPVLLSLPPTSTKSFNQYLKQLSNLAGGVPYFAVKTEFSFDSGVQYPKPAMQGKTVITDPAVVKEILEYRKSTAVLNAMKAFASGEDAPAADPNHF